MRILQLASRLYSTACRLSRHRVLPAIHSPVRYYAVSAAVAVHSASTALSRHRSPSLPLQNALQDIDFFFQRSHRVMFTRLNRAIQLAKEQDSLNPIDGVYMLQSTGEVLRGHSAAEREALAKTVWNLMDPSKLDVSHYNTLLRVYLENGTEFDPHSVLVDLKERSISPNRVTYQRLIERFCNMGDVNAATKIVEFMKSQQMLISEKIFHALMTGHLVNGDETAAFEVMKAMEEAGLAATPETFLTLACGLIAKGNKEKALEIIQGKGLSDRQTLRLVKAFALRDDLETVEALLETMPFDGHYSHILNTSLDLIPCEKLSAARIVFEHISDDKVRYRISKDLVAAMVHSNYSVSKVLEFCDYLKGKGIDDAFVHATRAALENRDRKTAIEYLKYLPDHGFDPLRCHFFAPIICKVQNVEELYEVIHSMSQMRVKPTETFFADFVFPRIPMEDLNIKTVQKLYVNGCSFGNAMNSLATYFLYKVKLNECLQLVKASESKLNIRLVDRLALVVTSDKIPVCMEILENILSRPDSTSDRSNIVRRFLSAIPEESLRSAVAAAINEQIQPSLLTGSTYDATMQMDPDAQLERAEGSSDDIPHSLIYRLVAACRIRDAEKVDQLLEELHGQPLNSQVLCGLISFYASKEDVENAMKFYSQLEQLEPFCLYDPMVIGLTTLLVKSHRLPEARELFHRLIHKNPQANNDRSMYISKLQLLIRTIIENYDPKTALDFIEENVNMIHGGGRTFSVIMEAVLKEYDSSESIAIFSRILNKYAYIPHLRELAVKLIKEDRETDIDQIMVLAEERRNLIFSSLELACAYIEVDQFDKARHLLNKIPIGRCSVAIGNMFKRLTAQREMNLLEKFSDLLDEVGFNSEKLCYLQLRAYAQTDNADKATELYMKMQEKDTVLSNRTLQYFSDIFKDKGLEAPMLNVAVEKLNSAESKLVELLRSGNIEEVIKYRSIAATSGRKISGLVEIELMKALAEMGKFEEAFPILQEYLRQHHQRDESRLLPYILKMMARNGMVDQIESLWSIIHEEPHMKHVALINALCQTYISMGTVSDLLDKLEKLPAIHTINGRLIEDILKQDPNSLDRIHELGKRVAHESQTFRILNIVWFELCKAGEFSKANDLLTEFPNAVKNNKYLRFLCQTIRNNSDDLKSGQLVSMLKPMMRDRIFSIAVSTHIDVLLSQKRVTEARDELKQLISEGFNISECSEQTIHALNRELALLDESAEQFS